MCSTFYSTLVLFAGKEEMPKMEKIETAILLAAQNGITDTVNKTLKEIPMAINVKSEGTTLCFWLRRTGKATVVGFTNKYIKLLPCLESSLQLLLSLFHIIYLSHFIG